MNIISIIMDKDRNLVPSSYALGVERDHKIDSILLLTKQFYGETNLFDSNVSLHLKAESGYTCNAVCTQKDIKGELVSFSFPITREMTCASGSVRIEFYFENASEPFSFTTRNIEFMVSSPLTDTSEIESDHPGLVFDILTAIEGCSSASKEHDLKIRELDSKVGVILNEQDKTSAYIDSISDYIGYTDDEVLGLEADFENNLFTRLAAAKDLSAGEDFNQFSMYGDRRRCNVSDSGEIVAFYGDESYRDDGSNGQVMVYQPKFYYRVMPTKVEKIENGFGYHVLKANYYISSKPKPFFKLHPAFYDENGREVEYILYSAYEGNVENNLLCSVAGAKPTANKSRTEFENLARARGNGWHIETMQAVAVNQLLFIIEYASFNSRLSIGLGISDLRDRDDGASNCASLTGSTASLGNGTGSATATTSEVAGVETVYTEEGKVAVSYRGVENLWGNIYTCTSNQTIWGDGTMQAGQLYVSNDFQVRENNHTDGFTAAGFILENGSYTFINRFGYGNEDMDWIFAPSQGGGSSTLPVGDFKLSSSDIREHRSIVYGGRHDMGRNGNGIFTVRAVKLSSGSRDISARLIFVPTAK